MRNREAPIGSEQAAVILDLSRSQVNRLAAAGELPFILKAPGSKGAYFFIEAEIKRIARERDALLSPERGDAA